MPIMPTILKCTCCGRNTEVGLISFEDPRNPGLNMTELVKMIAATNLCALCRRRYNWLAAQGRQAEFLQQSIAEVLKPAGYREP